MLAGIQGRVPERLHVVSPGTPFVERRYGTADYAAYYRFVKQRVGDFMARPAENYPEPG